MAKPLSGRQAALQAAQGSSPDTGMQSVADPAPAAVADPTGAGSVLESRPEPPTLVAPAGEAVYFAAARAYMDVFIAAGVVLTEAQYEIAVQRRAARPAFCAAIDAARAPLLAEIKALKSARLLSVVFGHHSGAPRPFALYRSPKREPLYLGAQWPDGYVVVRPGPSGGVMPWRSIDAALADFAASGQDLRVVWLSDELESLAEMEQQRDVARAEVERLRTQHHTDADGNHRYLSTWCLHGNHDMCASPVRDDGMPKRVAQCKTCASPCICPCHKIEEA